MPAEARIAPIWKKQKLFVAIFFIALGGWFWYDGLVKYPFSNERWNAYEKFKKEEKLSDWPAYAKQKGWAEAQPHKLYKKEDIIGQYVFGTLGGLVGLILLTYWYTQVRRVIRTDDEAVYTPSGRRVPFDAITGVGKKHWDTKGIAKVRYTLDGRHGQFVVDDYKFETDATRTILAEIEARLVAKKSGTEVS